MATLWDKKMAVATLQDIKLANSELSGCGNILGYKDGSNSPTWLWQHWGKMANSQLPGCSNTVGYKDG